MNSMASKAPVAKEGYKKKRILFTMRLGTINVYQNARYKFHGIKMITLYNYKSMFFNCDVIVVYGNSGLEKTRANIVALVATINKIVEVNSDNPPHLTRLTSEDRTWTTLKLFPRIMCLRLCCEK